VKVSGEGALVTVIVGFGVDGANVDGTLNRKL
jgi:hypothetical protein